MTRTLLVFLTAALFSQTPAFAGDASSVGQPTKLAANSSATMDPQAFNSVQAKTNISPSFLDTVTPYIKAGWNSQNDSPRTSEKEGAKYTFMGKQEFYLGARTKSGWALSAMYTTYQYTYSQHDPKHNDGFQVGDPSLTIGFPTLWKSGSWSLNSQFRYYYDVSHYYVSQEMQNVAYYLFLNGELPRNNELVNIFIPRYFYEPHYKPGQQAMFWEDRTQIGHRFSPWFRAGVGQWSQNEFHPKSTDGFCMDVYPYADFIVNKNLYFGPRFSLPVVASGSVFQGPSRVSVKEGFAELWLQASI